MAPVSAPTVGPWMPDHTEHASEGDVRRVYLDGGGEAATAGVCENDEDNEAGHCFIVWSRSGSNVADEHAMPGGLAAAQRAADAALAACDEVLTEEKNR